MKEKLKKEVKRVLVLDLVITPKEFEKRWVVIEKIISKDMLNKLIEKAEDENYQDFENSVVNRLANFIETKIRG
jgi:hypothetical protein